MRANFMLLALGAVLLSVSDTTASALTEKIETEAVIARDTNSRFLRRGAATEENNGATDDEERQWNIKNLLNSKKTLSDFSKTTLDEMLNNPAYKHLMFDKWDQYTTNKILSTVKNEKYVAMLWEYLQAREAMVRAGVLKDI
uniref:RxLR effector protein n=1 Tax=Phytophthora agathidicida TaxID=1642459 RepID=A0A7G4WI23_9STRA|nr:PaRXLR34 [Phytophthora agathidicida]